MSIKQYLAHRPILVILAEGFLSRLSFGIVSFALPLYARQLGLSLAETGVLLAVSAVAEQAIKPLTGHAADRYGLKNSYAAAIALRSLVAFLLVFAAAPWHLYAIRILHGVSESFRDPSVNTLIATYGKRKTLASSFAWYATAKTVAGSVGKAAAGMLIAAAAFGYAGAFVIAFLLSVLPLAVVLRYVRNDREVARDAAGDEAGKEGDAGAVVAEAASGDQAVAGQPVATPSIFAFATLGFLITATANMLHNLFPILATEYAGLTVAETGLIYTLSIPVVIVSGPLFGWVSDNVSRNLALAVRGAANILSSLLYIFFPTFPGFAAGKLVDDMGKAAFRPAWGALMSHVSGFHKKRRARTMGYLSFGEGLGEIVGPLLTGFLWDARGLVAVVVARVLLALVNEVYALGLARQLEKKLEKNR